MFAHEPVAMYTGTNLPSAGLNVLWITPILNNTAVAVGTQIGTKVLSRASDGTSWSVVTVTNPARGVLCIDSGDVDMDGREDLVFAISAGVLWVSDIAGSVVAHFADASAPFNEVPIPGTAGTSFVILGDIEHDGDLDVGFVNGNSVGWVENTYVINPPPPYGSGASPALFGNQHVVSQAMKSGSTIAITDVTGDGITDMVSSSYGDNKVAWYSGVGPRMLDLYGGEQLPVSRSSSQATSVYAFHLADIDADGDIDVISAGKHTVTWFENDGTVPSSPMFSGVQRPIGACSGFGARAIATGDIDGDGDTDVLAMLYSADRIVWYATRAPQTAARCSPWATSDSWTRSSTASVTSFLWTSTTMAAWTLVSRPM